MILIINRITLLAILGLSASNITTINNKITDSNNDISNINSYEKIDLTRMQLEKTEIDFNYLNGTQLTPDELKNELVINMYATNAEIKGLDKVFYSIYGGDNWIISGLPTEIPSVGKKIDANVKFIPGSGPNEQFSGVLDAKFTLTNEEYDYRVPLGDVIKENQLGTIEDTNMDNLLIVLSRENYLLDINEIEVDKLTYSSAIISAKENSKIYKGSVSVTFDTKLTFRWAFESKTIQVEAYNSTQEKWDKGSAKYIPTLGKENFLNYFKHVEFKWNANTWNNEDGNRYHNKNNKSGIEEEEDAPALTQVIDLTAGEVENELFDRVYSNVNKMKAYGYLGYSWSDNEENQKDVLTFNYEVYVYAYATAWNAYWAKTNAQLILENLIITR